MNFLFCFEKKIKCSIIIQGNVLFLLLQTKTKHNYEREQILMITHKLKTIKMLEIRDRYTGITGSSSMNTLEVKTTKNEIRKVSVSKSNVVIDVVKIHKCGNKL